MNTTKELDKHENSIAFMNCFRKLKPVLKDPYEFSSGVSSSTAQNRNFRSSVFANSALRTSELSDVKLPKVNKIEISYLWETNFQKCETVTNHEMNILSYFLFFKEVS